MRVLLLIVPLLMNVLFCKAQNDTLSNTSSTILEAHIKKTIDSSNVYYSKGNYAKSLESNIKLLKLAKKTNNPRHINKAYRFLAYDFLVLNDTLLARENFENAKKYAEIFNDDSTLGLSFMDLANYHSNADLNYNKALRYHDLSINKFIKTKDSVELAKAYYNGTITAFAAEKYEKAKVYLSALSQPEFEKYRPAYFSASAHGFWARYYNLQKKFRKAEMEARKALKLVDGTEYIIEKADAYLELAISLKGQKKYKAAYNTRLLYEKYNIESLTMRQNGESQAALAKLKVAQYQEEIEDQKEKTLLQAQIAENKNDLNKFLILVCIAGLLLFIALLTAFIKRRDLNIALSKKNEEYLEAKRKSDHLAKAKNKFFSTVSHELRTPLYGVIGLSTILLEDPNLKNHEKDLKSLKFSADYLLALINDVLQINKIDSKNLDNDESQFNVREFIQSIAATFEYMRLQNKNKIAIHIDEKIPEYLNGNVVRLSQILMNLVGNALKFTENGTVTISLSLVGEVEDKTYTLKFIIEDTGIGIPKDKQAAIFDEFTQVESLNYTYQGTGLGLPIVKKLLHASDSEIHLESEMGIGTTLTFNLTFQKAENILKNAPTPVLNQKLLNGKKILVAEDNRINQIVTKKILEKKGVECTIAENGKEALNFVKENTYDLLLMDLNMPIMDGFEATLEIRKFNTMLPIVALTAVEIEEVRNEIYLAGMDDIIVKPYDDTKFTLKILENTGKPRIPKAKRKVS